MFFCPGVVPDLLARGADVRVLGGSRFGSALHAAAYAHDADTVSLLISHGGADVGAVAGRYGTTLQAAAKRHSHVSKATRRTTGSSRTAGRQSVRVMRLLHAAGADVNGSAGAGKYGSPLQMAAMSGNLDAVKWLVENGADISARGGKFGGAMEAALAKEQWNVVSYLRRLGQVKSC